MDSSLDKKVIICGICNLLPHYREVRRYLERFVYCSHTVDDLVQETYLRAFRYYRATSPPRDPKRWLIGIADNVRINNLRKMQASALIFFQDI